MPKNRIKQVRKANKLSQSDFGDKLGVSRDVISNIEYDRVEPKDWFIDHLCNVFYINKDWLITGNGNMTNENTNTNKNIMQALDIINSLTPELQDYAIEQLRGIQDLQRRHNPR